jgi:formate hydrogenlyase subunit 3/multisubunit Na+/H+ antiporter MnhD subunit
VPATALLPASLDKLLGVYLLARVSLDMFQMSPAMNLVLLAVGSITIVAAAMMALMQRDMKRLLAHCAIGQVGYMVVGIGTATTLGVAGALFHMVNHAIYKACLFLSGGAVETHSGTADLEKMGGYAKAMPVTFAAFLIAGLSMSGVPPFNSFFSKWMIYQGIIQTKGDGQSLWIIWLVAAFFGSALTLASFIKVLHSVFLGQQSRADAKHAAREVAAPMLIPQIILAALCVLFGVFAYQIPLRLFIIPAVGSDISYMGIWNASLATVLLIAGLAVGAVLYFLRNAFRYRVDAHYIGGELPEDPRMRVSGVSFYNTVQEQGVLSPLFKAADKKTFDIYEIGSRYTFRANAFLRYLHNGILPTYLAWCLFGAMIVLILMLR